jgi:hypothetical protein
MQERAHSEESVLRVSCLDYDKLDVLIEFKEWIVQRGTYLRRHAVLVHRCALRFWMKIKSDIHFKI